MSAPDSPSPQHPTLSPIPSPPPPSLPLLPPPPSSSTAATPSTNPRRLPPPCWSHEETIALIDAYRDKWYSLRRGNLKANHWQEVAEAVAARCPAASPQKTAVQCRHKMEKLRKRYRTELQRARSMPVSRFNSSWVHFKRMDAMEKGPSTKTDYESESQDDENEEEEDDYPPTDEVCNKDGQRLFNRNGIGNNNSSLGSGSGSGSGGFRIRIPTGVSIAQPGPRFHGKMYASAPPKSQPIGGKREREKSHDPLAEMAAAIKLLGDGFVKMEQMKMEMTREIEGMRMDMEMKRTEMILESQQRIVEAFANALADSSKKPKGIISTD